MAEETLLEILKEIRELKKRIESLENLVQERLIGVDLPLQDEIEAIKDYEKAKKEGTAEYISLEDIQKQ